MPDIPAVCDNCGTFFPSGFAATNSRNISISNFRAGPCPSCGGTGHVPDGVYNFIGDTIELLQGPQRTLSELQRFAQVIQRAREKGATAEEVVETVQREVPELREAPQFSVLINFLTSQESRKELAVWLTLILQIIALAIQARQSADEEKIEVNQVINYINVQQPQSTEAQPQVIPKVGRNEPCPCGSGEKYKKCHGSPTSDTSNP